MVALACGVAGTSGGQVAFSGPANYATAVPDPEAIQYYAAHLAVADFTGTGNQIDGFKDVAVYSGPQYFPSQIEGENTSVITLFRNTQNWSGTTPSAGLTPHTQPIINVCTNCFVGEMQFADMNGDTIPDIVATSNSLDGRGSVHVWVYDVISDTYVVRYVVPDSELPPLQALGIGDFNGDGVNDVVVGVHRKADPEPPFPQPDNDRVIRLQNINDGAGFGALLRITPDVEVTDPVSSINKTSGDIVVGEFNTIQGFPGASVRPDFVSAEPFINVMTVGSGFGAFDFTLSDQPVTAPCGTGFSAAPNSMAAGNIDAGSTLDLVGAPLRSSVVNVFLGNGRGRLTPACDNGVLVEVNIIGAPPCIPTVNGPRNQGDTFLTLGRINGDPYPDILLASGFPTEERYVGIALGNGDGTFEVDQAACGQWLIYAMPGSMNPIDRVLAADMDNDGRDEVLVTASYENSLVVFRNDTED